MRHKGASREEPSYPGQRAPKIRKPQAAGRPPGRVALPRTGAASRAEGGNRRQPVWQSIAAGALAAAASSLLGALLVTGDQPIAGMVVAVLCGLVALTVTMREGAVPGLVGMVLVCIAGIFASGQEYPLFGATARDIPVAEAPAQHTAAIFYFTDGQVRADLAEAVGLHDGLYSRRDLTYGLLYVVPVVPAGWSRDAPVPAWAVSERGAYGRSKAAWAEPYQAAVRLTSLDEQEIRTSIRLAERQYDLLSAPNAPILRWVADPEAILQAQRNQMAQVVGGCSVLWGIAAVVSRVVQALRR